MLKIEFLEELLVIAMALSVVTCAIIQKTKIHFPTSKFLPIYSIVLNLLLGVIFCITFTDISFPTSLWVGLFSFLGADTIYKSLEGKLLSYSDILIREKVSIPTENIINEEEENNGKTIISK